MGNEREMKAFIFSYEEDARNFHFENYFSSQYDEEDPKVVRSSNPRVIGRLRRYATEIPNSQNK